MEIIYHSFSLLFFQTFACENFCTLSTQIPFSSFLFYSEWDAFDQKLSKMQKLSLQIKDRRICDFVGISMIDMQFAKMALLYSIANSNVDRS